MRRIAVLSADDAVPFMIVSVCKRDAGFDVGVSDHFLGLRKQDVAGGCVDVVDVGEDELQGTTLRTEHQIDVLDVPLKCVVDLLFCQQHQADHPHAKGQQGQTQGSLQGFGTKVPPCLVCRSELHGAGR